MEPFIRLSEILRAREPIVPLALTGVSQENHPANSIQASHLPGAAQCLGGLPVTR
jgi:hypothetical protein